MRRFPLTASAIALLTLLTACHQASPLAPGAAVERVAAESGARSVAGRLLVKWKSPEAEKRVMAKLRLSAGDAVDDGKTTAIDLPAGMSEASLREAAGSDIEYAEKDYIFRAVTSPVDPLAKQQYALKKVRAAEAWQVTRGSEDVRIAIVDTGADLNHPDLKNQIVGSTNVIGWRGKIGLASAKDDNGHGTHCAGIAAGASNGEGIMGMAPGCKLLIAKALGADGSGATSDIARGIHWAVKQRADVISCSIGGEMDAAVLRDAVNEALAAGIVVVAAMGNEGKTLKNYPAAYPGVIAVGATNTEDRVTSFSTRGGWISVCAPGANILSTTPTYKVFLNSAENGGLERTYGKLSGTSMATPLVAGVAGLMKSKNRRITPAQLKKTLERSAVAIGQGFSASTGYGRVDAAAALR